MPQLLSNSCAFETSRYSLHLGMRRRESPIKEKTQPFKILHLWEDYRLKAVGEDSSREIRQETLNQRLATEIDKGSAS